MTRTFLSKNPSVLWFLLTLAIFTLAVWSLIAYLFTIGGLLAKERVR